jgi:hypothetical protein
MNSDYRPIVLVDGRRIEVDGRGGVFADGRRVATKARLMDGPDGEKFVSVAEPLPKTILVGHGPGRDEHTYVRWFDTFDRDGNAIYRWLDPATPPVSRPD